MLRIFSPSETQYLPSPIFYTIEGKFPWDHSSAVLIMLGTLTANSDELTELAGSNGAFAYAYNVSSIQAVVQNWSESLSHMGKFTLSPATGFDTGVIKISIPDQTVTVRRPVDGFCEVGP